MHRKQYIEIAKMFYTESRQRVYSEESQSVIYNLALGLADILKEENPRFDHSKFMAAVEGEKTPNKSTGVSLEDIRRQRIKSQENVERHVDAACDELTNDFDTAVKTVLEAWNKRFTNHTFTAMTGMGSLSISVDPPVFGQTDVEFLKDWPGAAGEIGDELFTWYVEEYKVSVCDSGHIVK